MIKKLFRTEFDLSNLSLKRTTGGQGINKQINYKTLVVNKPWGYEYLLFENEHVAIWILYLKPGTATSMHCHPKKMTALTVLSGEVATSSLHTSFVLKPMDSLIIDSGVFHSTRASSVEAAMIMEIETPPDKGDLVRLKDEYGRENSGYEGQEFITSELANYEYCDFHSFSSPGEESHKKIKDRKLVLKHARSWQELLQSSHFKIKALFCPLNFKISNGAEEIFMQTGEICSSSDLADSHQAVPLSQEGLLGLFII